MRLNKFLATAGLCSRREADILIKEKRIKVNGLIATLGMEVGEADIVSFDEKIIKKTNETVLLKLNKPKGVVCTTKDPKSKDINIIEFVNYPTRIFPVGRLDKDSTGLILLTNDGDLSDKILRARNFHEKEYIVRVNKKINRTFVENMSNGLSILGRITRKCKVSKLDDYRFNIVLTEGINRQIRRMCESLGYRVIELKRVRVLSIELGELGIGEIKPVTDEEYRELIRRIDDRNEDRKNERPHKNIG